MIDLDGLNLNGYETGDSAFLIDPDEGFEIGAGPLEVKWVERHIGAVPLANPRLAAMETEVPLICVGSDDDDILARIGTLGEKRTAIQHSARTGGTEITWQKLGATYESTLDCFAIEIGPVKISVDDQRMRVGRFNLTITCGPFVLGPEYVAASGIKPAGIPVADIPIEDVKGDVPGPCKVEVVNQGTTAQQHVRMGLQWRDYVAGNDALLPASTFDVSTSPLNGTYTAGTNEVQTLTKTGTISGGTWPLSWDGYTFSAGFAHNASVATVQAAVDAQVGAGNITVGGTSLDAGNMTFTYVGDYAARNVAAMTFSTASLTGGGSVALSTSTAGVEGYAYAAVYSEWSAFMRTAAQTDTGSYDLWAHVYDAGSVANKVLVRAKIAVGDVSVGTTNVSVSVPACAVPVWVNLGPVHADPLPTGSHRWTATIEAKTLGTEGTSFRVIDIEKRPTPMGSVIVKTPTGSSVSTLQMSDSFSVTIGGLAGEVSTSGHSWAASAGHTDADDFTAGTGDRVERSTSADTATNISYGRIVVLGSSTPSAVDVGVTLDALDFNWADAYGGVVARHVDNDNFIAATYFDGSFARVYKVVAGVVTTLASTGSVTLGNGRLLLAVTAAGAWTLTLSNDVIASGSDSALATGGALDDGKSGIVDWSPGGTGTRRYSGFYVSIPPSPDACIHPAQTLEWGYDGNLTREASAGTYYAYAAGQQGVGVPMLGPAGSEGLVNRLTLSSDDLNPDYAASGAQCPRLDYTVTHRPAYAIGRHTL